jgi:type IV pilus assembly protein PilP
MKYRTLILFLSAVMISGCEQNADLQTYVAQVKARPAQPIDPLIDWTLRIKCFKNPI